jgi:hypothetical protein
MKTITITLCRRPDYTKILFDNLNNCFGIGEYKIFMFVEPINQDVLNLASNFRPEQSKVIINKNILGCHYNTLQSLNYIFSYIKSDYNIHLEDDTIPGKDCLRYFEWCNSKYSEDYSVFSATSYNKNATFDEEKIDIVQRYNWFTPWGFATWKTRWDLGYGKELIDKMPIVNGWDTITNNMVLRDKKFEIRPLIARTQNIGAENATHVPSAEWHRLNHYNEFWIESVQNYTDSFKEE